MKIEQLKREGREEFANRVVEDLLKMQDLPAIGIIAKTAADFVLDTLNEVNREEEPLTEEIST